MSLKVMVESNNKSIVCEEKTNVCYLVTEKDTKTTYRILPSGFTAHYEPNCPTRYFVGDNEEILL